MSYRISTGNKRLARLHHPDSGSAPDGERMKWINAARDAMLAGE